jgi:hypothetical protein
MAGHTPGTGEAPARVESTLAGAAQERQRCHEIHRTSKTVRTAPFARELPRAAVALRTNYAPGGQLFLSSGAKGGGG